MAVGKGRKFERLPEALQVEARRMMTSGQYTNQDVADYVNQALKSYSIDETDVSSIDDNTIWREGQKIQQMAERLNASSHAMKALADKVDLGSIGETGQLLMGLLQTVIFRSSQGMIEDEVVDLNDLNSLVLNTARLQRTANYNAKLKEQVSELAKKQALKEAAVAVEEGAKERGLSEEEAQFWRKKVLGVDA